MIVVPGLLDFEASDLDLGRKASKILCWRLEGEGAEGGGGAGGGWGCCVEL